MANLKISELTASGALTGTEELPIVQGGTTVRTTTQDIANLGGGGDIFITKTKAEIDALITANGLVAELQLPLTY